ncbi:malonyl CoA-acyl carrier protein transacylase [gut metagenome]|uniref:[acyl-carrier-protein] S-malonyltransferase n=1 Tax=gut metagenome TaxID=749906 RepID=J9GK48_9ZZZZ
MVEAVNFNAPGQVVIAGEKAALAKAIEALKARGCRRAIELPVSAPFHSSLLAPAGEKLAERLATIELKPQRVPVIANVDVAVHETADDIRKALARQASSAVQWVKTIERMKAEGVTDVVECGPGKVLTGLLRRTAPEMTGHNIYNEETLQTVLEKLS